MDVMPLSVSGAAPNCSLVERDEVRIESRRVQGTLDLEPRPGHERMLIVVRGESVTVSLGVEGPRSHARRFETHTFPGEEAVRIQSDSGVVELVLVTTTPAAKARAEALPIGTRGLREELDGSQALVYVPTGALVARLTAEDEPFELEAGDALWLRRVRTGDEVALEGTHPDSTLVVVDVGDGPG